VTAGLRKTAALLALAVMFTGCSAPAESESGDALPDVVAPRRARRGTADKEHLPDLFLDRHPRDALAQPRLSLLGLARLRRRDRRRVDRRRRGVDDRRVRLRFARAAREQAQRRKQRKNSSFHRVFPSFVRALCASLCRVPRLFPDFTMPRAQTQPAFPLCRASERLPPIRHQKPPSFDGGFWLCVVCIFRREKITSGIT